MTLFVSLVGCLCLSALACFWAPCVTFPCLISTLGISFVLCLHFGGPWGSIVTLGAPLCYPWTLVNTFACLSYLVRPWCPLWWLLGSVWPPLGSILVYFDGSVAGPWTPFSAFVEKAWKIYKKGQKNGVEMDACSTECWFVQKMPKCVPVVPARADRVSGHYFSRFVPPFVDFLFCKVVWALGPSLSARNGESVVEAENFKWV